MAMDFRKAIVDLLKKEVKFDESSIEVPKDTSLGDFALPCFTFAKEMRKAPQMIASELAKKLKPNKYIKEITANGPYLNFFINNDLLAEEVVPKALKLKDKFGSAMIGKGKHALIEHTSINPNASPHVGRARNSLIGDSLSRLLKFEGYKTEIHYFVNDIGKQIAVLVLGCAGKKVTFEKLLDIYVEISRKVENDDKLQAQVFHLLNKFEAGDKKVMQQFRNVVKICIDGQKEVFSELGIKFDHFDYESDYLINKRTDEILKSLQKTGKLFVDETGRKVLNEDGFGLEMKSPVLVLTRSDGTSLYPLRDIAYTIDKMKRGKDANIIVLGEDQKLYFQQLAAALNILGQKAPSPVHYSFVLLAEEGKMSTRAGNVVLMTDFMKQASEKAAKEILKRNPKAKGKELENISRVIGHGALKFSILKVSPDKNVTFDWDQALNFEGETGPYVQYAHARINSIFEKYGKKISGKADFCLFEKSQEKRLVTLLSQFEDLVTDATENLRPHALANYLIELAQAFNEFYQFCPILKEEAKLRDARLHLVAAVQISLKNGLDLLGIEAPERM